LIGPGQDSFQVVCKIDSQSGQQHHIGMERGSDQWSARHNGEDVSQLSTLTRLLPFVLLDPGSHTLVSGPPDGRRKYMDWGVFHVKHGYLTVWRRFSRTLKQRNAALRQSNRQVVESLNPILVNMGQKVHLAREQYTQKLTSVLNDNLSVFNRTLDGVGVRYKKGWAGDSLEEALSQSFQRDIESGTTGPGPHKADLLLTLDGAPAKERLSRGEQKAMTAAMLMAQAQMICMSGEPPVLMLDDLASELDEKHLNKVLDAGLSLGVQIWLTGTRIPGDINKRASTGNASCTVFHVEHGVVSCYELA